MANNKVTDHREVPTQDKNYLTVPVSKGVIATPSSDDDSSQGSHTPTDGRAKDWAAMGLAEDERDSWDNPLQFFFTIMGFCVGLGNIWRFPYLCQANGGGAFVIPFLIMMVIEGMPLLLLELGIGQKFQKGSFIVWNTIHPSLGGIGLGSTVIAIIVGCYYNVIIAWCLFYLLKSLNITLPWAECPTIPVSNLTLKASNISADVIADGASDVIPVPECEISSETQYFWYRETLDISPSISDPDGIRWWMFICLVVSWIIVYLIIMRGIKSSGKVVYFTALFPYLVLTIFFLRGITLKGAGAGLAHMFYPRLDKLLNPSVWLDAANQVFYSYGLAFGSIIGFGSYNPQDKNVIQDVYLISGCNAFTAVYACAVVFAILGFKAQHLFDKCIDHDITLLAANIPEYSTLNATAVESDEYAEIMAAAGATQGVDALNLKNCSIEAELDQAAQGTGLAFIVMADVFTKLPGAPFWSFLFFSMLLTLGLGSQIGIIEGFMGTLYDIPRLKSVKKQILSAIACVFCFLIGLVFTTGAGEYWLTLFDKYGAMGLTLIAFAELVSVMYVYGHRRFTEDIYSMIGQRPGMYWQATWRFVAPCLIGVILISSIISELISTPTYSAWDKNLGETVSVAFPGWSMGFALFLALASVMPIVAIAILNSVFKVKVVDLQGLTMRRVETDASSRPMLSNVQSFSDLPQNQNEETA